MGKKTITREDPALDELRALVDEGAAVAAKKTDRRGLLRLAGAAIVGAAGATAASAVPALAATGDPVTVDGAFSGSGTTSISSSVTTSGTYGPNAAIQGAGYTGVTGVGNNSASNTNEVGLIGASKSGHGTGVHGNSTTGAGVSGTSSSGPAGLFYSSTGYDLQLGFPAVGGPTGSGRLGMIGRTDVGGTGPNFAPAFAVHSSIGATYFEHEFVRGNDGSIWASRADAASATLTQRWKRINAVRFDTADGTGGVYKPFRLVDTRNGTGGQGGAKANGSTTTWTVAGAGTAASKIPPDAVAVFGNLTATGYTAGGYLAIFPAGFTFNPAVGPSNINFQVGQGAIANSFMVGLGTGGAVSVYTAAVSGTCQIIIDILGYIQ